MTIKELLIDWLNSMQVSEQTLTKMRCSCNLHLIPTLGAMEIGDVTLDIINSKCSLLISGQSAKNAAWRELYRAFQYAVTQNWLSDNPIRNADAPAYHRPKIRVLTRWEQINLTDTALLTDNRYGIAVLLSLYAGLTAGELCALDWANIDFASRMISLEQAVIRYNNVYNRNIMHRSVDLPEIALAKLYGAPQKTGPVFPGGENAATEPRTMRKGLERIIAQAGLNREISFRVLRDTYAVRRLSAGDSLADVSAALGIKTKAAYDRYSIVMETEDKQ